MLQVAVSVLAGVMLMTGLMCSMQDSKAAIVPVQPMLGSPFGIATSSTLVQLPSSSASPTSSFGTPVAGASPMPSAAAYTHTMFDN